MHCCTRDRLCQHLDSASSRAVGSAISRVWQCRALGADDRRAELQYWRRLLRYSCAFTLPVFLLAMVLPMMPGCQALFRTRLLGFPLDELLKWLLATPVQFWIGWRFHAGAWKALKNGRWYPATSHPV